MCTNIGYGMGEGWGFVKRIRPAQALKWCLRSETRCDCLQVCLALYRKRLS